MTRENLSDIRNFKNYLFIICRNQALNLVEKEKRLYQQRKIYEKDMLSTTNASSEVTISGEEEGGPERPYHLIDEAIDRLPAQQQKAWLLSRHEGMTYEEIATKMALSRETIKYYIRLANDSIKDYIADHNIQLLLLLLAARYL